MEILVQILVYVGGLVVLLGIVAIIVNLHDLFERVDMLEVNDNVRRDDIIKIQDKIMRMEKNDK